MSLSNALRALIQRKQVGLCL